VDNAPELTQGALQAECNRTGITYEKMVPDSPSQNGVAERCNRTLVSMARAMIIDAKLPEWFWTFAIQAAVHIKNRVPHSALPAHKTPFELWFHYKPNLSHLHLFGAHCTSRITLASGTKLSPRGEHGRHLGYAKDARGYIVWVPNETRPGGSVKVRRDVKFHDNSLLENAESWQNGNHEYDAGTPEGPTPTHEACAIYYPCMGNLKLIYLMPRPDDDTPMWDDITSCPERLTHKACVNLRTHGPLYIQMRTRPGLTMIAK
jgi:hypothetical protein